MTTRTDGQAGSDVQPPIVSPAYAQTHSSSNEPSQNRPVAATRKSHVSYSGDLEDQSALQRLQSHLSTMSKDDGDDLMRRLTSRRSAADSGSPDNVFNNLLGEIFDRDEMKKKSMLF
jgi:hypothetical protein